MNIKNTISRLIKKHGTSNPFELADALKIAIFYEELGTINGYYNKPLRMKQIHINCNLDEHLKKFTCAHELGHAILHPNASTPFLRSQTLFSVDRLEIEANAFAVNLLVPDNLLLEKQEYSIEQLSRLLGYDKKLIELRFRGSISQKAWK